ncbi:uncharacterized protein LOC105689750 [Athalia rosae]|uniref:uncharacterized protein LOC105689750 n=1 Tax=Athalia rosae TaxID=37344 RepID=UPI000625773F|nr:uncharacterized protein LOC105689750 [Athalia rosae]
MGKVTPKILALAVSAIRRLNEVRGSKSKDILRYVKDETFTRSVDEDKIKKQVKGALKRGLDYGILKLEHGRYSLSTETEAADEEIAAQEIALMEMCNRKRRRRSSKVKSPGK